MDGPYVLQLKIGFYYLWLDLLVKKDSILWFWDESTSSTYYLLSRPTIYLRTILECVFHSMKDIGLLNEGRIRLPDSNHDWLVMKLHTNLRYLGWEVSSSVHSLFFLHIWRNFSFLPLKSNSLLGVPYWKEKVLQHQEKCSKK